MDSTALVITPDTSAALPAPAAAADASKQDAATAAPFSAALDRELTRDDKAPASAGKADSATTAADATDEKRGAPPDAGIADIIAPPSLIAALALPAMPSRTVASAAAEGTATAPSATTKPTSTPPAMHWLTADTQAAAPTDFPADVRPAREGLPVLNSADSMHESPREAPVEMRAPPARGNVTREIVDVARDTAPALAADAHAATAHADIAPNTPIVLPPHALHFQVASHADSATSRTEQTILPHVGTAEWSDALAQKVTWMMDERHAVAELRLNPPDLGPLEIRLSLSGEDKTTATAQFASPHAPVREALEAAMPRLRELLAESGITLGNTAIADGALPREQQDRSSRAATGFTSESQVAAVTGIDAPRVTSMLRNRGLVDIFA